MDGGGGRNATLSPQRLGATALTMLVVELVGSMTAVDESDASSTLALLETPRGFFLKALISLFKFVYVILNQVKPFGVIPMWWLRGSWLAM
jgi:hypothetical protein